MKTLKTLERKLSLCLGSPASFRKRERRKKKKIKNKKALLCCALAPWGFKKMPSVLLKGSPGGAAALCQPLELHTSPCGGDRSQPAQGLGTAAPGVELHLSCHCLTQPRSWSWEWAGTKILQEQEQPPATETLPTEGLPHHPPKAFLSPLCSLCSVTSEQGRSLCAWKQWNQKGKCTAQ